MHNESSTNKRDGQASNRTCPCCRRDDLVSDCTCGPRFCGWCGEPRYFDEGSGVYLQTCHCLRYIRSIKRGLAAAGERLDVFGQVREATGREVRVTSPNRPLNR